MATGEGEGSRNAIERETLASYVEALPAGELPRGDRAARRRRVVPALRAHAAREHVRVRRRRIVRRASLLVTALGGAAAAVMLAAGPLARFGSAPRAGATIAVLDGTLWLDEGADRRALRAGEASGIEAKDELEAPAERLARVQLADTATMTLAPAALVGTLVAAADAPDAAPTFEAVKLVRGRAHLQVHKLHGGQRFHVLTPDADVQVRGTEFDVELRPGMTPGTCVRVEEGLVAVVAAGATHLVGADQSWGCEAPAAVVAPTPPTPVVALPAPASHAAQARTSASDLRLQNTVFQTALEAERDGRYGEAAQLYRRLLARAPRGPLAAQARSNLAVVSRPR
ncbi:MAG TPA: FecR family protein [Polyangia bacterium]|nr:FecR family protein [Polyangia bacterium]